MGSLETTRPQLGPGARPALWLEEIRASVVGLLALKRAALQTFSPPAVRSFFSDLDDRDRLLSRLGWALVCVVPMFAVLAYLVPGAVQTVNPWIKPIKFSISFATYVWTVSLFFRFLKLPTWQATLARRATAVSVILEMFFLGMQAWRTAQPYPSQSFSDIVISQMVTGMVFVHTVVMVWILVLCCGDRARTKVADLTLVAAIRDSIVIFLVGNAVGGYMLARGSHTVGAADGSQGLPFTNWSTIGGDLRIAHFIAVHAIQIVPLFAFLLLQMAPIPALRRRRLAVFGMSAGVMLVVLATFVQAALGHPLLPFGR
jgi:hypothetical protein